MPAGRIKCALLAAHQAVYDAELCLTCPGLELVALSHSAIGLPDSRAVAEGASEIDLLGASNPFGLLVEERAEVALIESHWYQLVAGRYPERIEAVMRNLERRADILIGLDPDQIALGFPPAALERLALVIKGQGLYRDLDRYNHLVGPQYPGAGWMEEPRPPRDRYRATDLEKLRLSVPCFLRDVPAIRRASRARMSKARSATARPMSLPGRIGRGLGEAVLIRGLGLVGASGRPYDVHCVVLPTHRLRIEAVRSLEPFSGERGLILSRVAHGDPVIESEEPRRHYEGWIERRRALLEAAEPFAHEPVGRLRTLLELRRHKVAVAPAAPGETTYRHGEALLCGTALVSQDLSGIEMMFPFRDRENVVYCRPDLSDLRATVEELLAEDRLRRRIAIEGRRDFMDWASRWREHLYEGVERHIREALGDG